MFFWKNFENNIYKIILATGQMEEYGFIWGKHISLVKVMGLVLFVLPFSFFAQNKSPKDTQPNVIIFIADDISWNDLGCYGNTKVSSPNIDSLSGEGMKFNNMILTTSSCSPSRISIITGRYPHNTGAAELHTQPKIDFKTIASQLKSKGYFTGQAGKWHMGDLIKNGFDEIHEDEKNNGPGGENMWLPLLQKRDKNKPFFLWYAAYDAHRPWGTNEYEKTNEPDSLSIPPSLVDTKETRLDLANYYDEITRFDAYIGKVVRELKKQKLYQSTLIIIISDNGRPFPRDKTRLYDSGIKSPFIVVWPGKVQAGAESNSLLSSIDLAPTILEACELEIPESFQGKSFLQTLRNPNVPTNKYVFAEHNWHDFEAHERMVRTLKHLYILNSRSQFPNQGPLDAINSPSFASLKELKNKGLLTKYQNDIFIAPRPKEELFDLEIDPFQTINLAIEPTYRNVLEEMRTIMSNWQKGTGDTVPENLTHDWYDRFTGEPTDAKNKRGTMPGILDKENK